MEIRGLNKPFDPASCNSEDKENEVALSSLSSNSNIIRTILITSGINISCFRLDQSGSLQVDNGDTVRARAPGHLTQLNTNPTLFLGECSAKLNLEHPSLEPVHTKAVNFPLAPSTFNHFVFNKNLFTPRQVGDEITLKLATSQVSRHHSLVSAGRGQREQETAGIQTIITGTDE